MAKKSTDIFITHEPTNIKYEFRGVGLRVFTESFQSEWNEETVFGRMDPILSFKGTRRNLSIEFIVGQPITTEKTKDEVAANIDNAEKLGRHLYPTYTSSNALSLRDPPLVRIYAKDFLQATDDLGLLCAVRNFQIDRGDSYNKSTTSKEGVLKSNKINVQLDLIPLHEYDLGWVQVKNAYLFGGIEGAKSYYFSNQRIMKNKK
jgi:hypothetical protein